MLGVQETAVLTTFCELAVPGSAAVGAVRYVERVLASMPASQADAVHSAIGLVATSLDTLAAIAHTDAFRLLRELAIEAYYGDYTDDDTAGPSGHEIIGFHPPQARRLNKDWFFLDTPTSAIPQSTADSADVVVVGSGAGGGLIAAELGRRGHDVLVIEAGALHPAADHVRFELAARHQLWWPMRATVPRTDDDEPVALLAGRCVGGTTVINTKVAMRAADFDIARFHEETGLLGPDGDPFAPADLLPWYERVESQLGVRERADWTPSVYRVRAGFAEMGASLEPVLSYTDYNCSRCGSCTTGCPTNAGKNTLNTFLAPALARGEVRLLTDHTVTRVRLDGTRVTGVDFLGADGSVGSVDASVVVLAAGSLNTPQILLRSTDYIALDTPSTRLVGTTLGLHPARLVYGRFDEPQDCHMAYPITAHCLDHQRNDHGGFVIEGTTIQEPVSFAAGMVDDHGHPLWGAGLARVVRDYRYWAGLLVMANDENTGTVELDPAGNAVISKGFSPDERRRLDAALDFATDVLLAAGAREVVWSGLSTSHVQGTARMGSDPNRSVVDTSGRAHGVSGLYVGDGSVLPASLSVNPSLTIMALAAMIAGRLAEELRR